MRFDSCILLFQVFRATREKGVFQKGLLSEVSTVVHCTTVARYAARSCLRSDAWSRSRKKRILHTQGTIANQQSITLQYRNLHDQMFESQCLSKTASAEPLPNTMCPCLTIVFPVTWPALDSVSRLLLLLQTSSHVQIQNPYSSITCRYPVLCSVTMRL